MKKLLLLLFSLLLSFNSYADWTYVGEDSSSDIIFMDLDTVKDSNGFVYWWYLAEYNELNNGYMSQKVYIQGDCGIPRIKTLSNYFYNKAMGEDLAFSSNPPAPEWTYLPPDTVGEFMLGVSCALSTKAEELSSEEYKEYVETIKLLSQDNYLQMQLESIAENLEPNLPEGFTLGEPLNDDEYENFMKSTYINNVSARIKSFWRYQGAEDDWECEVYVVQDRDGTVVAVDVRNCNVDDSARAKAFRDSVRRAVYKASPLPSAPDESVFDKELVIKFSVN